MPANKDSSEHALLGQGERSSGTCAVLWCFAGCWGKQIGEPGMAWLLGAIITYGIVVLLIGIAVMLHLFDGQQEPAAEAELHARQRFGLPVHFGRARRDVAPGTGALGAR